MRRNLLNKMKIFQIEYYMIKNNFEECTNWSNKVAIRKYSRNQNWENDENKEKTKCIYIYILFLLLLLLLKQKPYCLKLKLKNFFFHIYIQTFLLRVMQSSRLLRSKFALACYPPPHYFLFCSAQFETSLIKYSRFVIKTTNWTTGFYFIFVQNYIISYWDTYIGKTREFHFIVSTIFFF